jgi:glyoxylase-like metal-dependent hydrolase (beta-lactamase superfamily II)
LPALDVAGRAGIVSGRFRTQEESVKRLELREFDEEFGPGHTPGPDELRGAARARAIEAAFGHVGPGRVLGVERESDREIDVDMRLGTDRIEVQLNPRFRAIGVKPEDPGDE